MEDDLDIEDFIDKIKQHPQLWNMSMEDYNDKAKKRNIWLQLGRKFHPRFGKLNDSERNDFATKLMKKWKNLKDNYTRSLRKQRRTGCSSKSRKYIYAKQMSFLNAIEGATTTGNDVKDEVVTEEEESQNSTVVSLKENPPSSTSSKQIESASADKSLQLLPSSQISKPKRKRRKIMEETLKFVANPQSDEDRSFFESLLPTVKTFNTDQKLEFRSEVLNVIQRIRRSNMPPPSPPYDRFSWTDSGTPSSFIQPHLQSYVQYMYNSLFGNGSHCGNSTNPMVAPSTPSPPTSVSSALTSEENADLTT